ncbi:MAG: prepilin-type N-terminal cleavage/methylation domain-containing protein [Planctomycetota bacterium]|nr:prepilin-type N-terminal cleavage/methylation domain-containing protein [Planctomycetota bacterium]
MMTVLHRFRRRSPVRGGFTMVELLVVISIIALVIALVLPAYNSITSSILRRKVRATIAALESGCKRFKSENAGGDNNYPPGGAVSLLKCLTGSGMPMAVSGGGFQNFRPGGKVFGPYIDPDTVKIGTLSGSPVFKDAYGNVLAYYVRNAGGGFEGGGDPSISDPMAYCRRTSSAAATVDRLIASPGPNKQYGATAWDANDGDDIVTFVSEE